MIIYKQDSDVLIIQEEKESIIKQQKCSHFLYLNEIESFSFRESRPQLKYQSWNKNYIQSIKKNMPEFIYMICIISEKFY